MKDAGYNVISVEKIFDIFDGEGLTDMPEGTIGSSVYEKLV